MSKETVRLAIAVPRFSFNFKPFDNPTGKWKVDANGNLEKDASGNPIFVNTAGAETSVDGTTISRLNGEARGHRERADAAEGKLKTFEGIDPAAARTALDTVGKLDAKKLIDAGEVDKVRAEVGKQYDGQLSTLKTDNEKLSARLNGTLINHAFATSPYARENIKSPLDMVQSHFGNRFKVDGDKITATDFSGNTIMSRKSMGEPAGFDEALEIIIDNYPGKNDILKGNGNSGTGNTGKGGNQNPNSKTLKRGQYDSMSQTEKAAAGASVAKGELQIVD